VTLSVPTSGSQKTLCDVPTAEFPVCYISAKDKQKSRSLTSIDDVEKLATVSDNTAEMMLQVWRLGRIATASQLLNLSSEGGFLLSVEGYYHMRMPARLDICL